MNSIKTDVLCDKCKGRYYAVSDLENEVYSARNGDAKWQDTLLLKCSQCGKIIFAPKCDFTLVCSSNKGYINKEYKFEHD